MIYELASEWCSGCIEVLNRAGHGAEALKAEKQRATAELESLVAQVKADPLSFDTGLLRAGVASAISKFEQEVVDCFSFSRFEGYPEVEAAIEWLSGAGAAWKPHKSDLDFTAGLEKLAAAVQRARPSRSSHESGNSLSDLMHRIESMPTPQAERPAERPTFYVQAQDRTS